MKARVKSVVSTSSGVNPPNSDCSQYTLGLALVFTNISSCHPLVNRTNSIYITKTATVILSNSSSRQ